MAATGGIALAKDLLQVPIKKVNNSLGHRHFPDIRACRTTNPAQISDSTCDRMRLRPTRSAAKVCYRITDPQKCKIAFDL
jgi:hypothetical protein